MKQKIGGVGENNGLYTLELKQSESVAFLTKPVDRNKVLLYTKAVDRNKDPCMASNNLHKLGLTDSVKLCFALDLEDVMQISLCQTMRQKACYVGGVP